MVRRSKESAAALGKRLGVSATAIWQIRAGQTWGHLR
jgi:biotin operon repressor